MPKRSQHQKSQLDDSQWDGVITWNHAEEPPQRHVILTGIFRDDNYIAMDVNCAAPGEPAHVYTIVLRRESRRMFRGEWTTVSEQGRMDTGQCSCRLYSNEGMVALIGKWFENGEAYQWFAEMAPSE